ncbi:MBL fold metallo-hydrolase [Isoptericola sp. b441]|uniref:MBL fold metallo-hydrolase n=1 Tax=Actinotalea lenta TaxID=3064654 RepID=A0ABT9DA80_9CELL|nr:MULTISPECIES: MBL fold metallo-hydrolase [unclassified Isoptericola]MDO8107812.1 MBL fold metallo-hydrolase [Isoptericola sp. b441]MDO8120517.1 MBL fold metallo-hydrolase [Isoptericola sp. b490]
MLLRTVEAPLLGATCVLVVDSDARVAVVDAGGGVAERILRIVDREGWTPVGVLATHGHVDHTWDSGRLCREWAVPLHVHEADAYRLAEPFGTLGPLGGQLRAMSDLPGPVEPPRVATFTAEPDAPRPLDVGMTDQLEAWHLPGHTEGSTAYLVHVDGVRTVLTGDVLFAGTIGRTDLPGGDERAMADSLRRLAMLPGEVQVVPGHGPRTSIAAELRSNPFLRAAH